MTIWPTPCCHVANLKTSRCSLTQAKESIDSFSNEATTVGVWVVRSITTSLAGLSLTRSLKATFCASGDSTAPPKGGSSKKDRVAAGSASVWLAAHASARPISQRCHC